MVTAMRTLAGVSFVSGADPRRKIFHNRSRELEKERRGTMNAGERPFIERGMSIP